MTIEITKQKIKKILKGENLKRRELEKRELKKRGNLKGREIICWDLK